VNELKALILDYYSSYKITYEEMKELFSLCKIKWDEEYDNMSLTTLRLGKKNYIGIVDKSSGNLIARAPYYDQKYLKYLQRKAKGNREYTLKLIGYLKVMKNTYYVFDSLPYIKLKYYKNSDSKGNLIDLIYESDKDISLLKYEFDIDTTSFIYKFEKFLLMYDMKTYYSVKLKYGLIDKTYINKDKFYRNKKDYQNIESVMMKNKDAIDYIHSIDISNASISNYLTMYNILVNWGDKDE
jgi:hypothetical protein